MPCHSSSGCQRMRATVMFQKLRTLKTIHSKILGVWLKNTRRGNRTDLCTCVWQIIQSMVSLLEYILT